MEVLSQAEKIYYGLKARVAEHFGFEMNRRPKTGSYVRHRDGRVGRVIWRELATTHVAVQFNAFGKDRHKTREVVKLGEVHILNAMEVLAEASR